MRWHFLFDGQTFCRKLLFKSCIFVKIGKILESYLLLRIFVL